MLRKLFNKAITCDTNLRSLLNSSLISDKVTIASCINPHSCSVAFRNNYFYEALCASDIIIPDGIGIEYASKLYSGVNLRRVTGNTLFYTMMSILDKDSRSVYFLGATEKINELIRKRCSNEYPNIKVVGTYAPSFSNTYSLEEKSDILHKINASKADVLFIGLTAPKQEILSYELVNMGLNVKYCQGIGAMFDYYSSGLKKKNYERISRLRIEWLVRLVSNPKKMWRRTFVSLPIFLAYVIWESANEIFCRKN
jgi:N-acetylglucosaminyldiphosphoundecaprenol N-acetyl-beta-D-mannosaminyltransferase